MRSAIAASTAIKSSYSTAPDPQQAAAELALALCDVDTEFSLFFCNPDYPRPALADALAQGFGASMLAGCTTSGEITPAGYREDSITGVSFSKRHFTAVCRKISKLSEFGLQQARDLVLSSLWELREKAPQSNPGNTFALMLIDSISEAEELIAASIGSELGNIDLIGGSAGDNFRIESTPVYHAGEFVEDAAVFLLVHTDLKFQHYISHHFVTSDTRGVITAASPSKRLVHEINGASAAAEYARLCGIPPEQIDVDSLSAHPIIITVGGKEYVRGFSQILEDGSIRCACAIDEGIVFRVARPSDIVESLARLFSTIQADIGPPDLVLAFECAARKVEVQQNSLQVPVNALLCANKVVGFCSMGEQSNTVNMNNSFNCIAFSR
ncbi:MAG: FIST C-terminal domain-containing protein [Gammaproteobacteria bacterium]|nr:FIST C-terminal domain-containing protein [Gammaproteobacteria bacterium]